MKNQETNNQQEDTFAAIGIGAMIVFIALILVAAVASAVIIQTGEKLQQNAQDTGDDTSNSLKGKLKISGGYLESGGDYNLIVIAAPGSDDIADDQIVITLHCALGDDTLQGDGGSVDITEMDGTAATSITTDKGYIMSLTPTNCGSGEITLHLHVKGMGSTYEVFEVPANAGESLV